MAEEVSIVELEQNLADVEKPAEVPPGVYTGEVQDVQVATSQAGNDYWSIRIVIPPENLPPDVRDQFDDGAILSWNRQVLPKGRDRRALYNLRKMLEAFGLDANTTTIDPNEWMGRPVRVRVVHEKYQGEDRAQIRALEAAEAPKPVATKAKSNARGRR